MTLIVNGERLVRPTGETVAELLAAVGAVPQRVAVLVNDDVVPAAERTRRPLADGDRVEVLTFAGGG